MCHETWSVSGMHSADVKGKSCTHAYIHACNVQLNARRRTLLKLTHVRAHTGNERRQQCAFEVASSTVLHFCHSLLHARVAVFLRNAKNVHVGFFHIYARKTL